MIMSASAWSVVSMGETQLVAGLNNVPVSAVVSRGETQLVAGPSNVTVSTWCLCLVVRRS